MKLYLKFFLLFFFYVNFSYSQNWNKSELTSFASIDFPSDIEVVDTGNEIIHSSEDETGFYIANVRRLTEQQSSELTAENLQEFYDGYIKGILNATDAELISNNKITINEIPAIDLEYISTADPELPSHRIKRIIYLNQTILSIDYWPFTEDSEIIESRKNKFFNSFIIDGETGYKNNESQTAINVENNQNQKPNAAFETGFLIGQIMFFAVLIGVVVGIFLLIRYLIKKNKKTGETNQLKKHPATEAPINTVVACKNCAFENKPDCKYCSRCGYALS